MKNIIIILILLYPSIVYGSGATGSKLFKYCSSNSLGEQIYCGSYISGMVDGIDVYQTLVPEINKKFCKPEDFDIGLVKIIITDYLEKHPKELDRPAASSVLKMLRETYPCKKQ